jgi:hypothetical protein
MTKLLTEDFEKAARLPDGLQDEIATELLEELAWEGRWERALADSGGAVDELARKAIAEHEAGRTREAGFDDL